jgi:hypothetical protein
VSDYTHDKGRDCRRTDEVLDNYKRRALKAEREVLRLQREGSPGVLHEVDAAFYRLTVAERDAERQEVDRLRQAVADTWRSGDVNTLNNFTHAATTARALMHSEEADEAEATDEPGDTVIEFALVDGEWQATLTTLPGPDEQLMDETNLTKYADMIEQLASAWEAQAAMSDSHMETVVLPEARRLVALARSPGDLAREDDDAATD